MARQLLCFLIMLVTFGSAHFAQGQGSDRYQQAYAHFEQGQYFQALETFEQLLMDDPHNSALIYNVALCHQSLKAFSRAENYFNQLLDNVDYGDWATYQLAMMDWEQGYLGAAEVGLMQVVYFSADVDLVELATLRYEKLLESMSLDMEVENNVFGSVGMGFGIDDNIVDPRLENASDESDQFSELTISLLKQWSGKPNRPSWMWQGFLYRNHFNEIDGAELQLFSTEIAKLYYTGNWQYTIGVEYERSQSGGDDYLAHSAVNIAAVSHFDQSSRGWRVNYQLAHIKSLDTLFDQLAGRIQSLDVEYYVPIGERLRWRLGVEWADEDRDLTRNFIIQSDLSAQRRGLSSSLIALLNRWRVELTYESRDSDYGTLARIGSGLRIKREDDRSLLAFRAEFFPGNRWSIYSEFNNVDNDSNILPFTYQQKTMSIGALWQF